MTTGWRWIRDDGEETKSQLSALNWLRQRPESRIKFSELSMAGTKVTDVTDELRGILENRLPSNEAT